MATTIFTIKRDDDGYLYSLVLTEKSSKPTSMRGAQTVAELKEMVLQDYGQDAQFVPGRAFREEMESRLIHTDEMLALLEQESEARGGFDLTKFLVYGSALRPVSGIWMRIPDAAFIQVDKAATGYHTYVVVPVPLCQGEVDRYELSFVSGPLK